MALTLAATTFTHLLQQMGPDSPQVMATTESLMSILHALEPGALGHPALAPCLASLQLLAQSLFRSGMATVKAQSLALQISLAVAVSSASSLLQAAVVSLQCHVQDPPVELSRSIRGYLAAQGLDLSQQLSLCRNYKFRYSAVPHEVRAFCWPASLRGIETTYNMARIEPEQLCLAQIRRTGSDQLDDRHVTGLATDDVYLYVLDWRWGLTKHGTGKGNTNLHVCYEVGPLRCCGLQYTGTYWLLSPCR
jgi:hypothetical protein